MPTKGMVQVNEVAVKATPITSTPPGPLRPRARCSRALTSRPGSAAWYMPIRLKANSAKNPATSRLTQGLVANRLTPVAPSRPVIPRPSPV